MVEGAVKYTRLNFFVPVPQVMDLAELNAWLADRCRDDRQRRLRGKGAIQQPELPVYSPVAMEAMRQSIGQPSQRSVPAPAIEPTIHRLLWAVALWKIAPRRPTVEHPKHPVQYLARVFQPSTATLGHRNMYNNQFPFFITQIEVSHPCLPVSARFLADSTGSRLKHSYTNE